jgi:hypothetical protein
MTCGEEKISEINDQHIDSHPAVPKEPGFGSDVYPRSRKFVKGPESL